METKYTFNGEDITFDIMLKIEHTVNIIAEKENCDFDTAYKNFLSSKTYSNITNTDNWLWAESAEFIADDYFRELTIQK
ncbi:MAG: hypothetical protein WCY89_11915 [Flavobacteriaceae bacterium]